MTHLVCKPKRLAEKLSNPGDQKYSGNFGVFHSALLILKLNVIIENFLYLFFDYIYIFFIKKTINFTICNVSFLSNGYLTFFFPFKIVSNEVSSSG